MKTTRSKDNSNQECKRKSLRRQNPPFFRGVGGFFSQIFSNTALYILKLTSKSLPILGGKVSSL